MGFSWQLRVEKGKNMRFPLGHSGEEIAWINCPPPKAHFTSVSYEDLLGEEDVAVTTWNLVMGNEE